MNSNRHFLRYLKVDITNRRAYNACASEFDVKYLPMMGKLNATY